MTNLLKLLCLALSLSGCGPVPDSQIEPDLAHYVATFEQAWGSKVNFPVSQAVIDPQFGGVCYNMNSPSRHVVINATYWSSLSESAKEQLIFHELGHCALGRQHRGDVNAAGSPASIMYPKMFGYMAQYVTNRTAYIQELFGR